MKALKLRPFVPSGENYEQSRQFYNDLGFEQVFHSAELTIFKFNDVEFHLQNYCHRALQDNFMLELCVRDLDGWWEHVQSSGILQKYAARAKAPQLQPYGKRAIHLIDPAGVLWHITE